MAKPTRYREDGSSASLRASNALVVIAVAFALTVVIFAYSIEAGWILQSNEISFYANEVYNYVRERVNEILGLIIGDTSS